MKKELSNKLKTLIPSATLAVSSLTNELKTQGIKVYSFGAGEPDFTVNPQIKQAAKDAIDADYSRYTDVKGFTELREAVCEKLKRENGITYTADDIIVSSGAKHAVFTSLQVLLSEGDEVIVPSPYWVSYCEMVKLAYGIPVVAETSEENGFCLTAEELEKNITERTKAVIINNPCNPTGSVYDKNVMEKIAEVCLKYGIYIISDEIYDNFIYEEKEHISFAALSEEVKDITLTINGLSKTYAMPGWRVGYTAANKQIIKAMSSVQGQCVSHPSSISQRASITALTMDQHFVAEMRDEYDGRRKFIMSKFDAYKNFSYIHPYGAFYIFADISKLLNKEYNGKMIKDSSEFALELLNTAHVAVVPGTGFGKDSYIRFSYAGSMEDISAGLERFEKFIY